jgi:hypothetical protein
MVDLKGLGTCAYIGSLALAALVRSSCADAADLGPGPAPVLDGGVVAYGYAGFFYPTRIVPMPEASLYGDTARLRPTAVCQSRGLYADSVLFR